MVLLPQDCNHGKGEGKISVAPARQIPANETIAGKTTALQCCGDERGMFLSHGSFCLFLQEGNLGAGEKGVITPTTKNSLFTIQCCGDEQVFVLNVLRATYNSCATVVPLVRCGWFRNITVPTSFLAAAEIRGCFSVMAVAGCSYRTAIVAQVSCGSLMSEVFQGN